MTRYMGETDRARYITQQFGNDIFASPRDDRVVVDLGCRDSEIKEIQTNQDIIGVDREDGDAVDYWYDLDDFRNWSRLNNDLESEYVTVIASHVLEHLSDVHRALANLSQLANEYILIGLPNEINWLRRYQILRGQLHSKWNVTGRECDYHHWFFTIDSARALCTSILKHKGWTLVNEDTPYFELDPSETKWSTRMAQTIIEWFGSDTLRCRDWWGLFESNEVRRQRESREDATRRLEAIGYI